MLPSKYLQVSQMMYPFWCVYYQAYYTPDASFQVLLGLTNDVSLLLCVYHHAYYTPDASFKVLLGLTNDVSLLLCVCLCLYIHRYACYASDPFHPHLNITAAANIRVLNIELYYRCEYMHS
jgi:hypothetical protein